MKRVNKSKTYYKCVGTNEFKELERQGCIIISIRFHRNEIIVSYREGVLK